MGFEDSKSIRVYTGGEIIMEAMLGGIGTQITGAITDVLPIVGPIVGAVAAIFFGFKFFKKLTGARTS